MWRAAAIILVLLCLPLRAAYAASDGSWNYLIARLTADGVDPSAVERAFDDPRMPPFTGLEFSPQPRESHAQYRGFLRASGVALARSCRQRHADAFEAAERASQVPADLLAALLFVETGCGRNTGSYLVLYRLARLAMANEPANLSYNLARFGASDEGLDAATEAQLRARARYLEETFYPEVRATFAVARRMGVSPLDIRGSPSGAFGYPQFLPTSYLHHGADGDGDGRVSLYNTADAAASAARYLTWYGWRPGLTRSERREVIWWYNRSDAYVDTVLTLAGQIDGEPTRAPRKTVARRSHGKAKHRHR